jgi:hypothetical protein
MAHAISNSVLNFLHVTSASGVDVNIPLRMMVNLGAMFLALIWVRSVAEKSNMTEVNSWQ